MHNSLSFSCTDYMMHHTRPSISVERFLPKPSETTLNPYPLRPSQITPLTMHLLHQRSVDHWQLRILPTSQHFSTNDFCDNFPVLLMRQFFCHGFSSRGPPTMSHSYGLLRGSDDVVPLNEHTISIHGSFRTTFIPNNLQTEQVSFPNKLHSEQTVFHTSFIPQLTTRRPLNEYSTYGNVHDSHSRDFQDRTRFGLFPF
jgi:hypothetical protein